MELNDLLTLMTNQGASDLHLKPARPPLLRINGRLLPLRTDPMQIDKLKEMLIGILTPVQKRRLEELMAVDFGYGVPRVARFRGNIYHQRGHLAAVFRRIPFEIKTVEDLDLPPVLLDFCDLHQGLVLVTGPTGSGKSTTLAALIKYITANRPVHIITIEDPMEFLFNDGMASISQRELGTDTHAFAEALRNAMRQDPDVILVGEMRDPETVSTVISAAETGHLVFSTLHTNSATQTIDRILDTFPPAQQNQVRAQLAHVLKGVVSMKLVRRKDGQGRTAALEVMRGSPKIAKMIEKGETSGLHEELEASVGYYRMQSMNHSLMALLVHGVISYEEAMEQSPDSEDLSLKLRKMFPNLVVGSDEGDEDVSNADFAEIAELQQFRKLYEEQEERMKEALAERDHKISQLHGVVTERDQQIQLLDERILEMRQESEKMRSDYGRLKEEAQVKIDKLMERIRDLNQRMAGGGGGAAGGGAAPSQPSVEKKTGLFSR